MSDFNLLRDNWEEIRTIYEDMENELEKAKENVDITIYDPLNKIERKTQEDVKNTVNSLYQACKIVNKILKYIRELWMS